jgi:hypothetical protein
MKSNKHSKILDSLNKSINEGKLDSILNKLQFDFEFKNKNELYNYLTILLTLIETKEYQLVNNILFRKIINAPEKYEKVGISPIEIFKSLNENSVFPFVGLSNSIASLIVDIIDDKDDIKNLRNKIPKKDELEEINFSLLEKYFQASKTESEYKYFIRLLYNCIDNIESHTRIVRLSLKATKFFKEKLLENDLLFQDYLDNFLRIGGVKFNLPEVSSNEIVPEPYFEQIFGSKQDLIEILEKKDFKISKNIIDYLKKYDGKTKIYLSGIKVEKKIHKNLIS